MNNYMVSSADHETHLRIVTVSLILAIVIVWLGLAIL